MGSRDGSRPSVVVNVPGRSAPKPRLVSPSWQAAQPLFSVFGLFSPVFWVVLGTAMSIPLLVPEKLASEPLLAAFAQHARLLLMKVSPLADINAHARTTNFPNIALLSHAFMWTGLIFLFVFNTVGSLIRWRYHMEWLRIVRPQTLQGPDKGALAYLAAAGFCLLTAIAFSMMPGSSVMVASLDLKSRIAFSAMTGIVLAQMQFCAGWLPYLFYRMTLNQGNEQ